MLKLQRGDLKQGLYCALLKAEDLGAQSEWIPEQPSQDKADAWRFLDLDHGPQSPLKKRVNRQQLGRLRQGNASHYDGSLPESARILARRLRNTEVFHALNKRCLRYMWVGRQQQGRLKQCIAVFEKKLFPFLSIVSYPWGSFRLREVSGAH